jgi:hypothetical protein
MSDGLTVEFQVHFGRSAKGKLELKKGAAEFDPNAPTGNLPRVSRLMALAIRLADLVRKGEVTDYADLARLAHVTRARMTQIMNLLNLAPDIQEELLFLPATMEGRHPITEHDIRPIAAIADWREQRKAWGALCNMTTTTKNW